MRPLWPVTFVAFATVACGAPPQTVEPPSSERAVTTGVVEVHHLPSTFDSGGVVRARVTATIASRITAPVLAIAVTPGARVRAGQALVTLDGRDLEANRRRAAADIDALERARAAAADDRTAADAALTLARATHSRISMLHTRESATTQELDDAVSSLRIAEARLSAADAHVAGAAASLEGARQAAAAVDVTASFAVLAAPFDGLITERHVDPGNLATPGLPLLQIEETNRYRLETVVDESRVKHVAVRDVVDVVVGVGVADNAAAPQPVQGTVAEISRALDAGSHGFLVKVDLPQTTGLRSGMFGRARFAAGSRDVLTVPREAIVPQGQLSTVFVVSPENRARMRVIDTGESDGDRVEVLAGLTAGDRVVLLPIGLRDGDAVQSEPTVSRK